MKLSLPVLWPNKKDYYSSLDIKIKESYKMSDLMEKQNAEQFFRNILKQKGFEVNEKHENDSAIDIVAVKNGEYFLIDVKSGERARSDKVSRNCEFGVHVLSNGLFFPFPKKGKLSKAVRFFSLL